MFSLSKGKFTGRIVNKLNVDGVAINSASYAIDETNPGLHYHEVPHLCFLLDGLVESYKPDSCERNTKNLNFYHSGEVHSAVSHSLISKSINIEFGKDFLEKYGFTETHIEKAVEKNVDTKFLILKIQQEILLSGSSSSSSIGSLLLDILTYTNKLNEKDEPKWIRGLHNILNDRWNEQLTLSELSYATAVHPVTISKHFRKYFSCTLGEYLRKLKIDKSISFIKTSDKTLTEIAIYCGFSDQSHFTRNFKQMTGFLPKEYRNL